MIFNGLYFVKMATPEYPDFILQQFQ